MPQKNCCKFKMSVHSLTPYILPYCTETMHNVRKLSTEGQVLNQMGTKTKRRRPRSIKTIEYRMKYTRTRTCLSLRVFIDLPCWMQRNPNKRTSKITSHVNKKEEKNNGNNGDGGFGSFTEEVQRTVRTYPADLLHSRLFGRLRHDVYKWIEWTSKRMPTWKTRRRGVSFGVGPSRALLRDTGTACAWWQTESGQLISPPWRAGGQMAVHNFTTDPLMTGTRIS